MGSGGGGEVCETACRNFWDNICDNNLDCDDGFTGHVFMSKLINYTL